MFRQKLLVLSLEFKGVGPNSNAVFQTFIGQEILKTCDSIEEAESFIMDDENASKALVIIPILEKKNSRFQYFLNQNKRDMQKNEIAKAGYDIARALQIAHGAGEMPVWELLSDAARQDYESIIDFYLQNPTAQAEVMHKKWLDKMAVEGWGYAPNQDDEKKHSPYFMEFATLPPAKKIEYMAWPIVVSALKGLLPFVPESVKNEDAAEKGAKEPDKSPLQTGTGEVKEDAGAQNDLSNGEQEAPSPAAQYGDGKLKEEDKKITKGGKKDA